MLVARALSSYSDRHLGMLGRARELCTLWQSKRDNIPGQARQMLAEMESFQAEMERALGGALRDKDILIIGPGQQLGRHLVQAADDETLATSSASEG
jgi:hypothetical protein